MNDPQWQKLVLNFMVQVVMPFVDKNDDIPLSPEDTASLLHEVYFGRITFSRARKAWTAEAMAILTNSPE